MDPVAVDGPAVQWGWVAIAAILTLVGLAGVVVRRRLGSAPPTAVPGPVEVADPVTASSPVPPTPIVRVEAPSVASLFRAALTRTRDALKVGFDTVFGRTAVDESLFESLEEILLGADVGVPTAQRLLAAVRDEAKRGLPPDALRARLKAEMRSVLGDPRPMEVDARRPFVILVVGVNGSGKTTTIGKLAARYRKEGHRVLLAAGDTFRAAASDQLAIWADRAGAELVRHPEGADPGAVVFDALTAARARGCDVVLVDTAGRLQTRKPLMEQLTKIRRVIDKVVPGAPHETVLVVDGTTGQNALSQARAFHEATPLTGVVVTKLDGTAKGGVVLAIGAELGLPVRLVGIGEKIEDLRDFDPGAFVDALT